MADQPREEVLTSLRRHLYWVGGAGEHEPAGTEHVRGKLMDRATRLRADERVYIPLGEPNLGGSTRGRQKAKRLIFRQLRFMTWRYDRLLREQAMLTAALADRVLALEAELAAIREREEEGDAP
jgi:hypothetical protein